MPASRRVLLTGWASFFHGEATAGDLLALRTVAHWLRRGGWVVDTALSRGLSNGGVDLDAVDPADYSLLVFTCGPCQGWQIEELHTRFAGLRRIAVGVSVVDPESPAVTGFHAVIARDVNGLDATVDLAAGGLHDTPLIAGVCLANPQPEYGDRQGHRRAHDIITNWLASRPVAVTQIETRVSGGDWQLSRSADQVVRLLSRVDIVVTSRMHGLVLALGQGVPAIAVDPIVGGAKVSAQARAWEWPAVIEVGQLSDTALDTWWAWCQTPAADVAILRSRMTASRAITDLQEQVVALAEAS